MSVTITSLLLNLKEIQPPTAKAHARILLLICVLVVTDVCVARLCINHTFENGRSVFILFGFEFGLLVINIFNILFRYIVQCVDASMADGQLPLILPLCPSSEPLINSPPKRPQLQRNCYNDM